MTEVLTRVNLGVWGIPTIVMILGVGLFLSIRTGFAQIRFFSRAFRDFWEKLTGSQKQSGTVSPFQALCTALAATVGTGNIAGVAGAIALGGPGAIFWMWICGLLGMMTKYAEATLSVRYRVKDPDGSFRGGPMYMVTNGMGKGWSWLAGIYSLFGIVAALGVGNATQMNAVVSSIHQALATWDISCSQTGDLLLGFLLAAMVYAMVSGGAKRIGQIAERLVPFVSGLYLLLGFGVLIGRFQQIPAAFSAIFCGAFNPHAVTGGLVGSCFLPLRTGVSRGVFTNEAGMGTAAMAHGSAEVSHPSEQGLMGIMEVFLDTIVICTMTALVILVSGVPVPYGQDMGGALTTQAFCAVYGNWVSWFLVAAMACFAFATVLGWGLYGTRCVQYLFGPGAWKPFALMQAATVVLGAVLNTASVWLLSEIMNALMAVPNLIILTVLSPELVRLTNEFRKMTARNRVDGGTYESFNQCKPLRTLSYAEIPSHGCEGAESGKDHLSPQYRSAGYSDTGSVLRGCSEF